MSDRMKASPGESSTKRPSAADKYKKLQQEARKDKGSFNWSHAPEEELKDAIAAVTEDGAALLLSKTSDGGALVLRVITDQSSTPFYPADAAALNAVLSILLEAAKIA